MKNKRLKKCIIIVVVIMILSVLIACFDIFQSNEHTSDIKNYGKWDQSDINGKLDIFPESIKGESDVEYFYSYKTGLLDSDYQIYLKRQLSQEQYIQEIERLQGISNMYEGEKHVITYDTKNFLYPAYVSIYNFDSTYSYALCDDENFTIYYVYLQFIPQDKIEFDKALLPINYCNDGEKYNMYAYEYEEDSWCYQTE